MHVRGQIIRSDSLPWPQIKSTTESYRLLFMGDHLSIISLRWVDTMNCNHSSWYLQAFTCFFHWNSVLILPPCHTETTMILGRQLQVLLNWTTEQCSMLQLSRPYLTINYLRCLRTWSYRELFSRIILLDTHSSQQSWVVHGCPRQPMGKPLSQIIWDSGENSYNTTYAQKSSTNSNLATSFRFSLQSRLRSFLKYHNAHLFSSGCLTASSGLGTETVASESPDASTSSCGSSWNTTK